MNYLNLHTDLLRSEDYLGAEPVERATWLNLMAWCATQENGGVIENAVGWSDRKWQQLCGVTKDEASQVSELYWIDEKGNMIVKHYPKDKEEEVKTNRLNGKKGGRPKKKTQKKPGGFESVNPNETGCLEIAETERKGREGNGKEKEWKLQAESQAIAWTPAGGWSGITPKDKQDWMQAYPACDISRQLASANQWLLSNPSKAKKTQWRRFITGWLSRSQERGGDMKSNKPQAQRCL